MQNKIQEQNKNTVELRENEAEENTETNEQYFTDSDEDQNDIMIIDPFVHNRGKVKNQDGRKQLN